MSLSVTCWLRESGAMPKVGVTVVMLLLLTGCNRGVDLGSVEGRVTKDGQPQADLWVHFQPIEGRSAEGRTDKGGRYELKYSMTDEGALVGRHRVIVYSGGETDSRDNLLSPRKEIFRQEVDVQDGANTIDIEIK